VRTEYFNERCSVHRLTRIKTRRNDRKKEEIGKETKERGAQQKKNGKA
jgi:hypothetical protein